MLEASPLSSFDRSYTVGRLKRQARSMRLEAARAAALVATQLTSLASVIEAEAMALEGNDDQALAFKAWPVVIRKNP